MDKRLKTGQEDHFQVLDRIWAHLPEVPAEKVEQDVAEVLAAIRAEVAPEDLHKKTES
jgi:hypothetical protein